MPQPARLRLSRAIARGCRSLLVLAALPLLAALPNPKPDSTWPQAYAVRRDAAAGLLTLSTPYYTVRHDLKRGGVISAIRLTNGQATNLLVRPAESWIRDESGARFSDANDTQPRVSHRRDGLTEIVTVESRLADAQGRASEIRVRTVFQYHWGYIKVHKEFVAAKGAERVRELCAFSTILDPSLSDYGYREGTSEEEGAPPFSFGSNRWGKLRLDHPADAPLKTAQVPRSILFANPGIEGFEWFVASDLSQWEISFARRRDQGQCRLERSLDPPGLSLSLSPFCDSTAAALPTSCTFDFYLGLPLKERPAPRPWFHASFNRNRGEWVAPDQIHQWAEAGIQTVHCHNDGDYYEDGMFWRDGSYPPYPDMGKYDQVIAACQRAGIRVATYFSNKELHPSTPEFQAHGVEWGRNDRKGTLQHNFFRGTNEFGVQMCLRSGWLDFLKFSIDRVLQHHPLDGVYYDWNVALYCCNGRHEGKPPGEAAAGHWDIDELLDLMEWTRRRVGPGGLVIVHNTTTPMYATENFANNVVANEWGYGQWKEPGPTLADLPLEWSLVGARARGVISYGQLDSQSPRRLHRLFALQALLSGVTPWPASAETSAIYPVLRPLGDLTQFRFADWRNRAVGLGGQRCASAVYSRPGESYVLLANLDKDPKTVSCIVHPERLPVPLTKIRTALLLPDRSGTNQIANATLPPNLDARALIREGVPIALPGDSVTLLRLR